MRGHTRLEPWVSKKGVKLYPILDQWDDDAYIYVFDDPDRWHDFSKDHRYSLALVGRIEWNMDTGVIDMVSIRRPGELSSVNWRRQGIGTYLYRRAREITPHLTHSKKLSEDAELWIKSLHSND